MDDAIEKQEDSEPEEEKQGGLLVQLLYPETGLGSAAHYIPVVFHFIERSDLGETSYDKPIWYYNNSMAFKAVKEVCELWQQLKNANPVVAYLSSTCCDCSPELDRGRPRPSPVSMPPMQRYLISR